MDDHVALGGSWLLWRDFAVRSAGFAVGGVEAFGPGDEPARLRAVAADPGFREAMTWQNPAAVANALVKVAEGAPTKPSRMRQREEVVASYWQRYCAKNDTIGFFGPLAWGRIGENGDAPVHARSGALVRERSVHLEAWGVQALAAALDPHLRVPLSPWPERDLRALLCKHEDGALRERGLAALDRLEAARDAVAAADREQLAGAPAALDEVFVELTGQAPVRNPGRAYGARTLAYVDCMRDLDVTLGRELLDDIAPAVHTIFEAGRWYNGRIHAIGRAVVEAALPEGGSGPFGPVVGRVLATLMQLPPEIGPELEELQRRMAALVADPDPATIADRAVAAFADHAPAWPLSVYQSVDLQIAAPDEQAVADGDYLAIIGDVHPGGNPLGQGVFAHRHPDPARYRRLITDEGGRGLVFLLPPWGSGINLDARGVPVYGEHAIHIAINPESSAPRGHRTWRMEELWVDGPDLVDRSRELRVALIDVFALPIFVCGVRTWDPWADAEHSPRLTVGRTVLRRETWDALPQDVPERPEDLAAWAAAHGMPRRVFVKTPLERKPLYLDVESPVLGRIACRHIRASRAQEPEAHVRFTEMLPTPEQCWLADPEGRRYASELRLVGVDAAKLPVS